MYLELDTRMKLNVLAYVAVLVVAGGCAAPQSRRVVTLPGIVLDRQGGELRIDGKICIEQGILEYLAVASGGKEYESVFALQCRPSHLQAAMLIAGYEAGNVPPELRGDFAPGVDPTAIAPPQGAPKPARPPPGHWTSAPVRPTEVAIDVDVRQDDGTWKRYPVEHFLLDREGGGSPSPLKWAYTGSFFYPGEMPGTERFAADMEMSLMALFYDPAALLNLTRKAANPYRGEHTGFEAHGLHLPPKGTRVRLILKPAT